MRDDSDTEEEIQRKTFTLKQLIRKLHITEPVEHVMSLIGKRCVQTPVHVSSYLSCVGSFRAVLWSAAWSTQL